MNEITVLLATYNGEAYLQQQLDSLFAQKGWNGKILARDDGSTDRTVEILMKYPERITVMPTKERCGAAGNFSKLMESCDSPYMMFCDQDDIWKEDKIQVTFDEMKRVEKSNPPGTPALIHTDLEVVDSELNLIDKSYWNYAHLYPKKTTSLNRLLTQNVVTGCTTMINHSLAKLAAPIPKNAFMHDWWLALVASASGKIGLVDRSTIYYRQHKKNTLGAQRFSIYNGLLKLFGPNQEIKKQKKYMFEQAQMLNQSKFITPDQRNLIAQFLTIFHSSTWNARYIMMRYKFLKQGFARNLANFLFPNR